MTRAEESTTKGLIAVSVGIGCLVLSAPASAQDKLHPASRTQRAQSYKPIARTTSPATRVLNGSASILVRISDK